MILGEKRRARTNENIQLFTAAYVRFEIVLISSFDK